MEWQTIDTAPRDGTIILGYEIGVVAQTEFKHGEWSLSGYCWNDHSQYFYPSHWMPLPTLPSQAATSESPPTAPPAA